MKIGDMTIPMPNVGVSQRVSNGQGTVDTSVSGDLAAEAVYASIDSTGNNKDQVIDEDVLQKSVDQANKNLQQYNRFIEREIHQVTHAVMYKLVDSNTKEVISEFPPQKIQDMIAKMWELAGLFVDEKA